MAGLSMAGVSIGFVIHTRQSTDPSTLVSPETGQTPASARIEPPSAHAESSHSAADRDDGEPDKDECLAAVDEARALTTARPEGDLSRYFAERFLHQSMAEAGNGEFDDCIYWAQHAKQEILESRHSLRPGETFKVLQADETPSSREPTESPQLKPKPAGQDRHKSR